ncbi:uncharacterized protein BT62DRAFT_385568 [Guyanagaster necrorhizus]|uniref:Uncharacterized protein n=1 Tax=Guyanagaster necrorhizus TaxID=856835 RepID=A0A9P8AP22_9AGAR|nr:uncharacterized protein BT62DRAFT_385568 [Guyanagaster necrorhizus MCA 3950]KAG7442505.1 hypothetical protein BT62DRAFT_385568 [Guyanagaster necrorhizus MCA 3950]
MYALLLVVSYMAFICLLYGFHSGMKMLSCLIYSLIPSCPVCAVKEVQYILNFEQEGSTLQVPRGESSDGSESSIDSQHSLSA